MKLIKGILLLHILPFLLALITIFVIVYSGLPYKLYQSLAKEEVVYHHNDLPKASAHVFNFADSAWSELVLAQSLIEKQHLTVFGSSELIGSNLVCHKFFRKELGLNVTSVGHAYNELFAIYCQLLRMYPYLDSAEVSVILSPGWFKDGKGTNSQAFVEFVPPHFISHILKNGEIGARHKEYISETFHNEYEFEISGNRLEYEFLNTYHLFPFLKEFAQVLPEKYQLNPSQDTISQPLPEINWERYLCKSKEKSVSTLNDIFVDSSYYKQYLLNSKGEYKRGIIRDIKIKNNIELADLERVLSLLKEKKCKVSFIMQPLNSYYYENINDYSPIMDSIDILMKQFGFENQYYNMFARTKEAYEPGILSDVMHFSDYGWMKVNKFLYEQHFEK